MNWSLVSQSEAAVCGDDILIRETLIHWTFHQIIVPSVLFPLICFE
jgi:hypothetical protein